MFGNFAQSVEQSQDPGYTAQYFDHYRQMIDAGMDHQAAMNELKRRRQEEEYAKEAEFNSRQASYGKTPEDFAAGADTTGYQRLRAADAAANTGAMPTAEQVWGDQINGGPMGPVEFGNLQDKLLGSGEAAGSAGSGGQSAAPGGGPEVTRAMHLEQAPTARLISGSDPSGYAPPGGTPQVRDAAFLAPGTPMGAMSDMLSGATDGAMVGGVGFSPTNTPRSEVLSGAMGSGVQRLASTVAALPDGHPEKAAYSGLVDQLKQGNVHAIPQALQAAQQPEVNSTLGNSIQAQKDSRAKKFAQAMGMLNEMQHDGKHGFDQISQFFGQIKQKYPEFASGHVRGMTDSQVSHLQSQIQLQEAERKLQKMGLPPENILGFDNKGKPQYIVDPADYIAKQREQNTERHQLVGEAQANTQAQQKHNMGLFAAEMKMYQSMIPKPLAEGAGAKQRAGHDKRMQMAMAGMADVQDRMTNGGTPHAATIPQGYNDAMNEESEAAGAQADQTMAGKQAAQQSTIASQQGNLQLGQDKFADMQQHRDTVADPMAAEMHDAKLKQMDQQSVLADTKLKMAQIGQQMAAKGLEFKQQQIDQAAQKFTYQQTRDAKLDEQHVAAFQELQKKNLSQQQNAQVGQMLRAIQLKKPAAPDPLTQMFAETPDDQVTDKNRDQVQAAKLAVKLHDTERKSYNDSVDLIINHAKSMVGSAKPAASGAFNSGGDAEAAFSSGKIKPGQPFTVSGKQFTFDQNGKAIPAGQ